MLVVWRTGTGYPHAGITSVGHATKKKKIIYIGIGIKMGVVVRNGRSTSLFGHPDWAIDFAPVPCCFFFLNFN